MTITLRTMLADDAHAFGYNAGPLLTWFGDDDDRPTGGERVHFGWSGLIGVTRDYRDHIAGNLATLDGATHLTVYATTWGDYVGDDVQRSNARSLTRDFPEAFVTVVGDFGSEWLAVDLDAEREDEDAAYLADILTNLSDQYPLYDEEDHSNLLADMADDDWTSWARDDYRQDYRDALVVAGFDDDDADNLAESADLSAMRSTWESDQVITYRAESATSGTWDGMPEALAEEAARQFDSARAAD